MTEPCDRCAQRWSWMVRPVHLGCLAVLQADDPQDITDWPADP